MKLRMNGNGEDTVRDVHTQILYIYLTYYILYLEKGINTVAYNSYN